MKSISQGDIFLTKSPIQSEDMAITKALNSALMLIDSRPVLIVRPPMSWDSFSTVTVIPAYNNTNPSICVDQEDNYGAVTTTFSLVPHIIQTIPVVLLSRHLGHLDYSEMHEIVKTIHWLTGDDAYRNNEGHPIPECLSPKVVDKITPSRRSYATVLIDSDGRISFSEDQPARKSTTLTKPSNVAKPTATKDEIPVPQTKNPEQTAAKHNTKHNTLFPQSIFAREDLCEVADRFTIAPEFYEDAGDKLKRPIELLEDNEIQRICEELNPMSMRCVLDVYGRMHSVDALIFGPLLPTTVLARLCFLNHQETIALKKICSKLKILSDEEIEARKLRMIKLPELPEEPVQVESEAPVDPYAPYTDPNEIKSALLRLRPYLSEAGMRQLPAKLYGDFIRVPEHYLRRAYSGKCFAKNYEHRCQIIRDRI